MEPNTGNLRRETWGSRTAFVLAAAGSAIGLGNIWRFPYLTGQNGGAAFVLIYLLIVLLIGLPVMMAEVSLLYTKQGGENRALVTQVFISQIYQRITHAGYAQYRAQAIFAGEYGTAITNTAVGDQPVEYRVTQVLVGAVRTVTHGNGCYSYIQSDTV